MYETSPWRTPLRGRVGMSVRIECSFGIRARLDWDRCEHGFQLVAEFGSEARIRCRGNGRQVQRVEGISTWIRHRCSLRRHVETPDVPGPAAPPWPPHRDPRWWQFPGR